MNIVFAQLDASGQLTVYGELDGFEHNFTVSASIADGLMLEQVCEIAVDGIREAYERFIGEQL